MGRAERGQSLGWAQTIGWNSTKFGMVLPLDPVGNIEILLWVNPPDGGNFFDKQKNPNFPHGQDRGRNPFVTPYMVPFAQFWED